MEWRKKVYELLEAQEGEDSPKILEAMKTELSNVGDTEAKLRIALSEVATLKAATGDVAALQQDKTGLEAQIATLAESVQTLTTRAEQADEKATTAQKAKAQMAVRTELMKTLPKVFGPLTGDLLSDKYSDKGLITLGEDGTTLIFNDGGAEYKGNDVVERIKTLHKDSIIGEDGPGSNPGNPKKTAETVDMSEMSSHDLYAQSLSSEQI